MAVIKAFALYAESPSKDCIQETMQAIKEAMDEHERVNNIRRVKDIHPYFRSGDAWLDGVCFSVKFERMTDSIIVQGEAFYFR